MIAAWMVYSIAVTLLIVAGATLAEFVARALGASTRVVWGLAMVLALGLSGRALIATRHVPVPAAPRVATRRDAATRTTMSNGAQVDWVASYNGPTATPTTVLQSLVDNSSDVRARIEHAANSVDSARLDRWNAVLVALWISGSVVALLFVAASFSGLRRLERGFAAQTLDGHAVLVSHDVGPALLGVIRTRIVVPEWVLSLSDLDRKSILAHERQHALAFDPAFLCAGTILLALTPWNVGLWMIFARLRLAVEADCDRRVLGIAGDVRAYGTLLVRVYGRTAPAPMPYVAFVERTSHLERRIRRLVRRPRLRSFAAAGATFGAVVLTMAAWTAPAPRPRPSRPAFLPQFSRQTWHVDRVVPPASTATLQNVPYAAPRTLPVESQRTPFPKSVIAPVESPARSTITPPARLEPCDGPVLFRVFGERQFDKTVGSQGANTTERPSIPVAIPREDCSYDADLLVVGLDSSRVFIAMHDAMTAVLGGAVRTFIVNVAPNAGIPGLSWFSGAGHAEFRDGDFYIASPVVGVAPLVFGSDTARLKERYPDATRFERRSMTARRVFKYTFDWMRVWGETCGVEFANRSNPGTARPLYVVDGGVVNNDQRAGCLAWLDG